MNSFSFSKEIDFSLFVLEFVLSSSLTLSPSVHDEVHEMLDDMTDIRLRVLLLQTDVCIDQRLLASRKLRKSDRDDTIVAKQVLTFIAAFRESANSFGPLSMSNHPVLSTRQFIQTNQNHNPHISGWIIEFDMLYSFTVFVCPSTA